MSDAFSQWPAKLNRLLELAEQAAEARAECENLDNIKPTVLALEMKKHPDLPVAGQQREAHASAEYQQWCRDRYAAMKRYEWLRLRYQAALLWFEMARSQESSNREEMRLSR